MPSQKLGVDKPPQREDVGGVVPDRVLGNRRHDAGGHADQQRDDDGDAGELERDRELFQDQVEHRLLDALRLAEVPLQHAAGPVHVTHRQRIVQVQRAAQVRDDGGIMVFAGEDQRRVPGQQLLQPENQDRDEEQRRDDRRQALDEEVEHLRWPLQYRIATLASSPRKRGPICSVL